MRKIFRRFTRAGNKRIFMERCNLTGGRSEYVWYMLVILARNRQPPILLDGLSKLEYRGYDSAGLAVARRREKEFEVVKAKGRLKKLAEKTDDGNAVIGSCRNRAIPRWATHGGTVGDQCPSPYQRCEHRGRRRGSGASITVSLRISRS